MLLSLEGEGTGSDRMADVSSKTAGMGGVDMDGSVLTDDIVGIVSIGDGGRVGVEIAGPILGLGILCERPLRLLCQNSTTTTAIAIATPAAAGIIHHGNDGPPISTFVSLKVAWAVIFS